MNMILHELTTNAVKYGALSPEGGQVVIQWAHCSGPQGECVLLSWKEVCRSRISSPVRSGLGSKILTSSARHGLGGDIAFDYQSDGLLATLVVPTARLATPAPAKNFRSR
jgi:two-component sensor histidine kinase